MDTTTSSNRQHSQLDDNNWYSRLLESEANSKSHLEKVFSIDKRVSLYTQRSLSLSPVEDLTKIFHLLQLLTCEYLKAAGSNDLIKKLESTTCNLGFGDIPITVADALMHTAQYTMFNEPNQLYALAMKYFQEIRPLIHTIVSAYFGLNKSDTEDTSPF